MDLLIWVIVYFLDARQIWFMSHQELWFDCESGAPETQIS